MGPKRCFFPFFRNGILFHGRTTFIPVLLSIVAAAIQISWGSPAPTRTSLTLTSGSTPVTTLVRGRVVTLTATVVADLLPVTPGQVDFCNSTAVYCTDINLLGTAQLSKSGVAIFRFVPSNGTHSYKAVFRGTNSFAPSSSTSLPLMVTGRNSSVTTIASTGVPGNYSLQGTVFGSGKNSPSGEISFLNTTNGSTIIGSANLVSNPAALNFAQSFTLPFVACYPNECSYQAVGDFNNDGLQDVVATMDLSPGQMSVGLGDGTGKFKVLPPVDLSRLGTSLPSENPRVADFDGDGNLDLALRGRVGGPGTELSTITICRGDGGGGFAFQSTLVVGPFFYSFAVADFNRDGIPDIALVTDSFLLIYRGNGDGTFSASPAPPTVFSGGGALMLSADFNRDGNLDLAVSQFSGVSVLLGNGDDTFKAAQQVYQGGSGTTAAVADFNEDGRLDLIVYAYFAASTTGYSADGITVLLGNGDGTFAPAPQGTISVARGSYESDVTLAPANFDGHADLAIEQNMGILSIRDSTLLVLLGKGDGTLTWGPQPPHGQGLPAPICVADFNGDGRSDIAATGIVLLSSSQSATANLAGVVIPPATGSTLAVADFPGDGDYLPSTSMSTTLKAAQATPTVALTASPNPATSASPVTLNVAVSGSGLTPTGTVQLWDGSAVLGTLQLDSSGMATYLAQSLDARVHTFTAMYGGDTNYTSAAPGVLNLTVNRSAATPTLTSSALFVPLGLVVTFKAIIAAANTVPTGLVTFQDGTTQLSQVVLDGSGAATYSTSSLGEGTHTISISYGGDNNYAPASSSSVQVVSSSKPFLTVSGTPVTIAAGAISGNTSTISITSAQGFAGTVTLAASITSGPSGGQYPPMVKLSTSTVNVSGTLAATTILTVSTTGSHRALLIQPKNFGVPWREAAAAAFACVFLFGYRGLRRNRASKSTMAWLAIFLMIPTGMLSCGGGKDPNGGVTLPGTTAGAYTVTVTATSGPINEQGSFVLVVQ